MRSIKLSVVLLLTQFCILISHAQSTSSQIKKLKEDWNIITHKKDKKEKQNNNGDTLNSTADNSSTLVKKENSGQSNGLKPGDIAPDAKVIDADFLSPFYMGAAIIQKGNSFALIDKDGNFIVPFNKYKNITHLEGSNGENYTQTNRGFFAVNNMEGIINSKGKLLTEGFKGVSWILSNDAKLIFGYDNLQKDFIYIDENGQKYIQKQNIDNIVDGIGVILEIPSYKKGYKTVKADWIVKPIYDAAEPFSDGMACVGKKNEFGEMKYGFINESGKEVIPLIYSKKPSNFHGGLARIEPKDTREFVEAFIDKKGNIVKKFNQFTGFNYFGNGIYAGNQRRTDLMDSTGIIISKDEFLQRFGISLQPQTQKNLVIDYYETDPFYNTGKICFSRYFKAGHIPNKGFIDLRTKVIVEGTFDNSTPLEFIDPVSKLSYAKFNTTGTLLDKTPLREGYINEQGIFVIVKAEDSKW